MTRYNFVSQVYSSMPQGMRILDAKAAVDKEWKKVRDDPSMAIEERQE